MLQEWMHQAEQRGYERGLKAALEAVRLEEKHSDESLSEGLCCAESVIEEVLQARRAGPTPEPIPDVEAVWEAMKDGVVWHPYREHQATAHHPGLSDLVKPAVGSDPVDAIENYEGRFRMFWWATFQDETADTVSRRNQLLAFARSVLKDGAE
jgi:hypothetical protein